MKLFTLSLMMFITVFGLSVGFRAITGRDMVTLKWPFPAPQLAESAAEPTPAATLPPAAQPTTVPAPTAQTSQFEPWWVQNHTATDLWSGPDSVATSLGRAQQWSYFQVIEPQNGPRLHVRSPSTGHDGYIDAAAVGPVPGPDSVATPSGQIQRVVGNTDGLGVYVRGSPRADDKVRAWPDGTSMTVIEEGVSGEGRKWAKVQTPDGETGYVPEEYLVSQR